MSGATVSSNAIMTAVKKALKEASGEEGSKTKE
ncbi:FMN-binding protein [Lactobacillus delbrueckii]|nr:FMN-binding protein [Lactobacillus delbrueckii]